MTGFVDQLMAHQHLQDLPPAVREKLRKILPHFLDNGVVQCRHYGGQQFGWRIRYRVTDPTGQRRQGSLSLGTDGRAVLAAQLLSEFKRDELANEQQLRADEQTRQLEARRLAGQMKHLRQLFMRQAPGSLKTRRQAWQRIDLRCLTAIRSPELQETLVTAYAREVRRPARGRPRKRWFGSRPSAADQGSGGGLLSAVARLMRGPAPQSTAPADDHVAKLSNQAVPHGVTSNDTAAGVPVEPVTKL